MGNEKIVKEKLKEVKRKGSKGRKNDEKKEILKTKNLTKKDNNKKE